MAIAPTAADTADLDAADATKRRSYADATDFAPMEGVEDNRNIAENRMGSPPGLQDNSSASTIQPQVAPTGDSSSASLTPERPQCARSASAGHQHATTSMPVPPVDNTNSSASSRHQNAASTTPVHPQGVQDPLHTGLSQNLQGSQADRNDQQRQPAMPPTTQQSTTDSLGGQHLYSEYVEAEITRSAELIAASQTTLGKTRAEIPTWETLSTATDTTPIRSLLAALAFNTATSESWTTLGLSRLEGPKPSMHMLQSRRDVALKLIDSCSATLHEVALREITRIRANICSACDECCANLDTNAQERRHLKGNNRNVPRWMEPSEDLLDYVTTLLPTNSKIALHLSNLTNADFAAYANVTDVNTARQIHTHLCGPPDEVERALTRLGDQPLLT